MNEAKVDLIGKGGGKGDLASYIQGEGRLNPGMMRPFVHEGNTYVTVFKGGDPKKPKNYQTFPVQANATLRRDEWKQLDEAILPIAESRLRGIQDLVSMGLVYNLGNAMGTTVLEWHDVGDAMEADLTMDGVTRSKGDRPNYNHNYLPVPIIHVDYEINTRALEASRRLGNPLDTTSAERAARKVSERLENMLFTNTSYTFGAGTIYSYLNFPQRNTVTLDNAGGAWDGSQGVTGKQILDDVLELKQALLNDHFFGPYKLYVPSTYETILDEDYSDEKGSNTIRQRIEAIANINSVSVADFLPDGNVLLVQMTSDVVRLVRGMGIQNVQWQTEGQFINKYKVLTIQVPQIRSDQEGRCGIAHGSFN